MTLDNANRWLEIVYEQYRKLQFKKKFLDFFYKQANEKNFWSLCLLKKDHVKLVQKIENFINILKLFTNVC